MKLKWKYYADNKESNASTGYTVSFKIGEDGLVLLNADWNKMVPEYYWFYVEIYFPNIQIIYQHSELKAEELPTKTPSDSLLQALNEQAKNQIKEIVDKYKTLLSLIENLEKEE